MDTKKILTSVLLIVVLLGAVGTGVWNWRNQSNTNRAGNQDRYTPSTQEKQAFQDHAEQEHGEGHEYVNQQDLEAYELGTLSEQEIADIQHMRQEEKLARDVYRTLGQTYPINQFKNIPLSEQNHTDAMELLIERYGLDDPIVDESLVGVYRDEKFTQLFEQLTTQGEASRIEALTVGAIIEDANMAKLLEVISNTDNEDIKYVYESVLTQSHHHMNAFILALKQQGASYTPEYVTQDYFDSIIQ